MNCRIVSAIIRLYRYCFALYFIKNPLSYNSNYMTPEQTDNNRFISKTLRYHKKRKMFLGYPNRNNVKCTCTVRLLETVLLFSFLVPFLVWKIRVDKKCRKKSITVYNSSSKTIKISDLKIMFFKSIFSRNTIFISKCIYNT